MVVSLAALGCGEGGGEALPDDPQARLVARGKHYYDNVCVACHSGDPSVDGTLGPAVAGSTEALVEAKVMRAEYPPGYTPKRNTATMPRFPYLEPEIGAIAAYLQSLSQGGS